MTNKELLYVKDALGHEKYMKECCKKTAEKFQDVNFSNYMEELEQVHMKLYNKFQGLL